ncbi:sensor histidine kinase [Actinomadura barringtoniae]|uniref:histidine kinase n=1 Tax=Actinomadura barringtoniae TaxID=1427535 RepID=A0A939PLG7_9ACTN|nr:sensor histidine kinase [Actinomadura barringtoniae]MBO2452069.1 sensor histidine kinase [Actinomadura barringtoniae]
MDPLASPPSPRLPRVLRPALPACAVTGLALVLCAAITSGDVPSRWENAPIPGLLGVAAVMAMPVGWTWRRPWPVLTALLAEVAIVAALRLEMEQVWPLFVAADLVVVFLTAVRTPRAGLAGAAGTLLVQQAAWQGGLVRDGGWSRLLVPGFIGLSVLLALSVVAAWLSGTALRQRREHGEASRAHAAAQAVTAERLRIARELHDMVAHSIGVIAIQAGAGGRVLHDAPDRAQEALTAIEATSRQTLYGLRHMLGVLRETDPAPAAPAVPDPLAGLAELDRLVAATEAAGVTVEVRRPTQDRALPPTVDHAAFRIVQESLTNVIRHARARRCQVTIDREPDELRLEIVDDGTGEIGGCGYGISGMRERVALLDGHFNAGPGPGGGFRVRARLPLSARDGRRR